MFQGFACSHCRGKAFSAKPLMMLSSIQFSTRMCGRGGVRGCDLLVAISNKDVGSNIRRTAEERRLGNIRH